MASIILRPWASFIVTGVVSMIISYLAVMEMHQGVLSSGAIPVPTILGLFAFALVAWLSSRSLENALQDLRTINEELDQRVEDRTRELREANQQLADANTRLRELDRLKSQFVSMVSHELRTPLNAIQGFGEMISAELYGAVNEKQREAVGRIIANTKRLLYIVNDLLDQARMEAGQLSLHMGYFAPLELFEDLQSTMGVLAESRGLTLETYATSNMPEKLYGDKQRLHQILVNLVNNAIKFTEEGGVKVRMYRENESHWTLEVSDTGLGIPEMAQNDIFEPFRQLDGSVTREYSGVGLGLAIVKQLVTMMSGTIVVKSEEGQGSTFSLVLPLDVTKEEEVV